MLYLHTLQHTSLGCLSSTWRLSIPAMPQDIPLLLFLWDWQPTRMTSFFLLFFLKGKSFAETSFSSYKMHSAMGCPQKGLSFWELQSTQWGSRGFLPPLFQGLLRKEDSKWTSPFTLDDLWKDEAVFWSSLWQFYYSTSVLSSKWYTAFCFNYFFTSRPKRQKYRKPVVITSVLPLPNDPQAVFINYSNQLGNVKSTN